MEIGFTKLGVQRIREMLSFVLGSGLSFHFLFEKPKAKYKNTVTSGEGKQVLIWTIKRFKGPGFHLYSISVNLMLELNILQQAH